MIFDINTFFGLFLYITSVATILSDLSNFELIDASNFHQIRDVNLTNRNRHINFATKDRYWQLSLSVTQAHISTGLSVTYLGVAGHRKVGYTWDRLVSFEGHVANTSGSHILAVLDEYTHDFFAKIMIDSNVYFLEPLSVYPDYKGNNSWLLYQAKDIGLHSSSIKGRSSDCISNSQILNHSVHSDGFLDLLVRRPRTADNEDKLLCSLTLIADYTYFKHVGDADGPTTVRLIIALFHLLNLIYRKVPFLIDKVVERTGYGFLLQDIIIHDSWNLQPGHYNAQTDAKGEAWTAEALTNAFNRATFNKTCLAHLLTYRPFTGVLGRSWMAGPDIGGICSPPIKQNDQLIHTNTGWTTYADHSGRRLLNSKAELITAHELGHSWGAAHDPDTAECNPSSAHGGNYLMYEHMVAGFAENNYKFSPCSRRTIGSILAIRAPSCFSSSSQATMSWCGDKRLDPGEECDAGAVPNDSCCMSNCKLRPKARCSPWNHDCCTTDCQVASHSATCIQRKTDNPCIGPGRCDGVNTFCPTPTNLSGIRCPEHGWCINGVCQSVCERFGLRSCICDTAADACYICCVFTKRDIDSSAVCKPIEIPAKDTWFDKTVGHYSSVQSLDGTHLRTKFVYLHLDDDRPCMMGYCLSGSCQRSNNSILRFWSDDDEEDERSWVDVIRDNFIVLVVGVSLICWSLLTILIRVISRKKKPDSDFRSADSPSTAVAMQ